MIQIEILRQTQKVVKQAIIDIYKFRLPRMPESSFMCVGIDPGVTNMAMCAIPSLGDYGFAFQLSIPRIDDAVQRIQNYGHILSDCNLVWELPVKGVVEGAAFSERYRQVELAEARTAVVMWLLKNGANVQVISPNSLRKRVFGSGKTNAHDIWEGLPDDCLAALSCAYYADMG